MGAPGVNQDMSYHITANYVANDISITCIYQQYEIASLHMWWAYVFATFFL